MCKKALFALLAPSVTCGTSVMLLCRGHMDQSYIHRIDMHHVSRRTRTKYIVSLS